MTFVAVRTQLKAIIDGIASASGIATVYDYPMTTIGDTPAVAILDDTGEDEYASTARNTVHINYVIRAMVEKSNASTPTDSAQLTVLLTLVDALSTEIRKKAHADLSENTHSLIISEIMPSEVGSIGDVNLFFKDIKVTTTALKTIV